MLTYIHFEGFSKTGSRNEVQRSCATGESLYRCFCVPLQALLNRAFVAFRLGCDMRLLSLVFGHFHCALPFVSQRLLEISDFKVLSQYPSQL